MQRQRQPQALAYITLAIGIVCIGFSAIFVKLAGVAGLASAFYRVFFAGIIVVPWGIVHYRHRPAMSGRQVALIAAGGIVFGLELAIWNTSLLYTSAANSTLLANNASLWVGLAALLLFRERLSARYWIGLVLALVGMAILVGALSGRHFHMQFGDLLAAVASLLYAAYLLITERARAGVDTLTLMAWSLVPSILMLFLLNLATGAALTGYSHKAWLALLALGLISHMVGWLALNYSLGHLRAAPVSVSLLAQSVVTALASIPLLGESLSRHQIIGGVVVLSGIYLANQRRPSGPVSASGEGCQEIAG
jgi:drug/metabolite transporter (DMT)-like permease